MRTGLPGKEVRTGERASPWKFQTLMAARQGKSVKIETKLPWQRASGVGEVHGPNAGEEDEGQKFVLWLWGPGEH